MTLDDELRRRLQQAADHAGEGTDTGALTGAVAAQVGSGADGSAGAGRALRLFGGLGAAGLVVGGVLGFTLLRPSAETSRDPRSQAVSSGSALRDCPDGSPVGSVQPGDRLLAVGRTEDGSWIAVRGLDGETVSWLPAAALDTYDGRDLAVLTCADTIALNGGQAAEASTTAPSGTSTTSSTVASSTTTAAPTTAPVTAPPTAPPTAAPTAPPTAPPTTPPPDTQQPTVQASSNRTEIYDNAYPTCDNEAVLTATATDNVGVTSVTGTWSGLPGSPLAFANGSGNTWTAQFGPFSGLGFAYNQLVTITITAKDAAGNTRTTTVHVQVYGECLL